ncbi:MAG: SUMF1/EgtB/PvdO family nonheme iron enzyme [Xanthomonadales bacterium]|jgi:formylglycine-generating enzyme required for sulfatase activity|nr:SUMF1/EgtB/PvdO family nonheme iron enzyme [Xanthomonadales bacterium]MDH4001441.1 SUMF1/EgtB/PvdO family nonheme iron enzyme [Xanthomonadales bacterium]
MAFLMVVFDICFDIRDSELQMLQARDWLCILLLVAGALPGGILHAQNNQATLPESTFERLGEGSQSEEYDLDLTVPLQQPAPAEDSAEEAQRKQQKAIARQLAAARKALQEGRIDQPPSDCAWTHYRSVLDIDPQNEEALQGLRNVQQAMVDQALAIARDLDFETANRTLEDASLVLENPEIIEQAREEMVEFRADYIEELEIRAVNAMDSGDFALAERQLIELIAMGGVDTIVSQLRRRLEEAKVYGGFKPGQIIRDHFINQGYWTPESVIVLAGSFQMGSSAFEEGRVENEGPRHRVTFRRGFAIGKTEVTVKQFRQFVNKTGYKTDAEKQGFSTIYNHHSGRLTNRDDVNWEQNYEGQDARDDDPVVHVSWNDATAYVQWLARGTGKAYRLPTEAEFEYALRGGQKTRYWWGDDSPSSLVENLTGEHDLSRGRRQWSTYFEDYEDNYWGPAPVGSFGANPFGLHDIAGNVGEWVRDCWHDTYLRAPADGSAWLNPGCKLRIIRGGFWASSPDQARAAYRLSAKPDRRDARVGFRIARDL